MSLIDQLKLKTGSNGVPLTLPATPVTLIVGPNNSGKSLILKELNDLLRESGHPSTFKILGSASFNESSLPDSVADLAKYKNYSSPGNKSHAEHIYYLKNGDTHLFHEAGLMKWLSAPELGTSYFNAYVKSNTIKLDGQNRIGLVAEKSLTDLTEPPKNRLEQLFKNDTVRSELRSVIYDALKAHIVLDPTKLGYVRVRLSSVAPASILEEKGIHPEAVLFHEKALNIVTCPPETGVE